MGMTLKLLGGLFDGLFFAMAAVCMAGAALGNGGRFSGRLDVLTHFAPFWLAGAALALAYGLFHAPGATRLLIAGGGAVGVIAAAALIAPEYLRPMSAKAPDDAPRQIKIIQLNAWVRNPEIDRTADWLVAQDPDVIVVEEIDPPLKDALLKRRPYNYVRGMLHTAIFTRAPLEHRPIELKGPWEAWPGLARARLAAPDGKPFDIIGLHYTWPTTYWQKVQRKAMAGLVAEHDRRRLIVVGDFNLTPWSFTLRQQDREWGMERRSRGMFSWPVQKFAGGRLKSPVPFLAIDQVYAGSDWRTISVGTGPKLGSDHLPVIVRLALKN